MSAPFEVPSFDDDDTVPTTAPALVDADDNAAAIAATTEIEGEGEPADAFSPGERPDDVMAHMGGALVPADIKSLINAALEAEAAQESGAAAAKEEEGEGKKGDAKTSKAHVVPTGQGRNARVLPGDKRFPFCFICASRHAFGECERDTPKFDSESD